MHMNVTWTAEQVSTFAPDENSRRASRRLAGPEKWSVLGAGPVIVWGMLPVKDKPPIQTAVRLADPVFACSCGNRRTPCDHALGLLMLWVEDPATFQTVPLPEWVQGKLTSTAPFGADASASPSHQAQTDFAKTRDAALQRGLEEVELWLHDLVRNGLADIQQRPKASWAQVAERLVDAGAGDLAGEVRRLADIPASVSGWPERLLGRLGMLYLLIQGFERLDSLPSETQSDLRAAVGGHARPDVSSGDQGMRDRWHILSSQFAQERKQRIQKTWLWGESRNRAALILQRPHKGVSFDMRLVTGTVLDADVRYFPGTTPIRARIEQWHERVQPVIPPAGYESVDQAVAAFSQALSANPWIGAFPALLQSTVAVRHGNSWALMDASRRMMPLPAKYPHLWHLVALTRLGNAPVFGEWDGETFNPLSVWAGGRWIELRTLQGIA